MDENLICYCGLYCGNCAVKARVHPAAVKLRDEMEKAGFGDVINAIPGGGDFWKFLSGMVSEGICVSCQKGSGNPGCAVRKCAQEKGMKMCALCESYPCDLFQKYFKGFAGVFRDNDVIREKGMKAWSKMQDDRRKKGYTYADEDRGDVSERM